MQGPYNCIRCIFGLDMTGAIYGTFIWISISKRNINAYKSGLNVWWIDVNRLSISSEHYWKYTHTHICIYNIYTYIICVLCLSYATSPQVYRLLKSYPWWRHEMETFSALLAICAGNSSVTGGFPAHKGQWRGALMLSLICIWINGWVNNRKAVDLRRHCAHYDVIAMLVQNDVFKNNLQLRGTGDYL